MGWPMISLAFFVFLIFACVLALLNWRWGVFLLVIAGVLQDPVRKMMPDAPPLMVMAFLPIWLALFVGMINARQWPWRSFSHYYGSLRQSMLIFLPVVLLATVVLFFHYGFGAWKVSLVGIFSYSLPLLTLLIGFAYANSERDVYRFLRYYCFITAVILIGGVLEVLHVAPDWNALGTSVFGTHWIRYISWGHTIDLIAGFYRAPDIMGWHAATLTIISLSLALYGKSGSRWLWLLLACWGILLVLISGRNKVMGMTAVWVAVVALIYFYHGHLGKVIAIAGAGGLLIFAVLLMSGKLNLNQDYIYYASQLVEGKSSSGTVLERLDKEVISTTIETYRESGFFGKGIGSSAQGIQHLGVHIKRSWQESGASRILVELGVPGVLAALFFIWSMFKVMRWMAMDRRHASSEPVLRTALIALAIANASNFLISHQVYNDGFILVMLSLFIGFLLASPGWYSKKGEER